MSHSLVLQLIADQHNRQFKSDHRLMNIDRILQIIGIIVAIIGVIGLKTISKMM